MRLHNQLPMNVRMHEYEKRQQVYAFLSNLIILFQPRKFWTSTSPPHWLTSTSRLVVTGRKITTPSTERRSGGSGQVLVPWPWCTLGHSRSIKDPRLFRMSLEMIQAAICGFRLQRPHRQSEYLISETKWATVYLMHKANPEWVHAHSDCEIILVVHSATSTHFSDKNSTRSEHQEPSAHQKGTS